MASGVVNDSSLVEARETQIEDAHDEETYAEEIQVHETLSDAHVEETHVEETHAEETHVQVEARETQIEAHAEEIQVQIPNNGESQIDDANAEETRLQFPGPSTPVSMKKKAEDEPFSPWKLRKLSSTPQIQVTSSLNHKSKPIATNPIATTQNAPSPAVSWGQKCALAEIWKKH